MRLVRVNISVLLPLREMAAATFILSIWWTRRNRWVISTTVTPSDSTSWRTGSVW